MICTRRGGGVLTDGDIETLVAKGKLITDGFASAHLRPSAYDVRVARDGIITPLGELYRPAYQEGSRTFAGSLVLHPGDTAELSSLERFAMPYDVAGNITIKTDLARSGLLLLTGLLVDPGFGLVRDQAPGDPHPFDGRLHFFVANIGSDPVVLVPGQSVIARLQFLHAEGPTKRGGHAAISTPSAAQWREGQVRSLGFIADLKALRAEHSSMRRQLDTTSENTRNVLVLGYFLLAATILGLTLNNLLSAGSNADFVDNVNAAVPDDVAGKGLIVAVAVSIAWITYSIALLTRVKPWVRRRKPAAHQFAREEAITLLRLRRWRRIVPFVTLVPVALITGLVYGIVHIESDLEPWLLPFVVALIVSVGVAGATSTWQPITDDDIRDVMDRSLTKNAANRRALFSFFMRRKQRSSS